MSVITHNISAMTAQRNYKVNTEKNAKSSERLSSGFKINYAADNAAGLQISEQLRIQSRGLNRASRNIDDGISYVQVADGALGEAQSMLHRMKELAIQAANDTNTEFDRQALDAETQQLKTAVDDIFKNTEFNSRKIWAEKSDVTVDSGNTIDTYAVEYDVSFPSTLSNQNSVSTDFYELKADSSGLWAEWTDSNGNMHKTGTLDWEDEDLWKGSHQISLGELIDIKSTDGKDYSAYASDDYSSASNFSFSWNVSEHATKDDMINSLNNLKIYNSDNSGIALAADGDAGSTSAQSGQLTPLSVPVYRYEYTINIQAGSLERSNIELKYSSLSLESLAINDIDVLTHSSASDSIDKIASALDELSEQRTIFGAYQNRMEHAGKLADNTSENSTATDSRLRDTDMAEEMVTFSNSSTLSRTGEAVITKTTQESMHIVDLLR